MKVLCTVTRGNNSIHTLTTLDRFHNNKENVPDNKDWIFAHIIAIAEHVLNAMQPCYKNRQVLDDTRGVATELCNLFRIDAADCVLNGGPNGVHHSYLYDMWN